MTDCLIGILIVSSSPLVGVIAALFTLMITSLITYPFRSHKNEDQLAEMLASILLLTFFITTAAVVLFGGAYAFGAFA